MNELACIYIYREREREGDVHKFPTVLLYYMYTHLFMCVKVYIHICYTEKHNMTTA